ncbi:hypothetical protein L1049_004615 [Liquidambar formosana]|uniref:Transmembrane protein n=1 Tax=Liquidambar formosana TaxID=63359 RepID=A0AAP0WYE0_LIQFO
MHYMASADRDLENGGTTSEEDGNEDPVLGCRQTNKLFSSVLSGFPSANGSYRSEYDIKSCSNFAKFGDVATENVELLIDRSLGGEGSREHVALVEKKCVREKCKKTDSKRPAKPPRPPKGPSLDAADQKLVREISELAMKKRARIERVKLLKKMRAAKASSSSSTLSAMVITLLFCLVIIFQGISSRSSSSMRHQGSPEPAVTAREALISVQYYKTPSANEGNVPSSTSLNFGEHISGSRSREAR